MGDEKRFDHHKIKDFLLSKGIGECPTVTEVIREKGNASDEHLTVVSSVDLATILPQVPHVNWLFTTGGKATEVLIGLVNAELTNQSVSVQVFDRELQIYRLPSSSRAYPMSLANKAEAYARFFRLAGLID
jgi:G:T/U-mismatch repair DNA glycosylase